MQTSEAASQQRGPSRPAPGLSPEWRAGSPSPRVSFGGASPAGEISGKRVLVVGLGLTGLAVSRFLKSKGARVTVSDNRPPAHFQRLIGELVSSQIAVEMGQHEKSIFCRQDLIVVSPGVDLALPVLEVAREQGIPVVSEIEVAGWFLRGRVLGITGSNGKTTTTTLLGQILAASGFPVHVGGNIGTPLISQLDSASEKTLSVVELSSFQLEAIDRFRPDRAVMLNLTPDHLDRHGSLEHYEAAKGNIFRNQGPDDCAVLNADDPRVMKFVGSIRSRLVFVLAQAGAFGGCFRRERRGGLSDGKPGARRPLASGYSAPRSAQPGKCSCGHRGGSQCGGRPEGHPGGRCRFQRGGTPAGICPRDTGGQVLQRLEGDETWMPRPNPFQPSRAISS